jgi:quercetin dioxygenase-like cupin family protein
METVMRDPDRDELVIGAERVRFRLTSEQSEGEAAVLDVTLPAGGGPPMLHRHDPLEVYSVRSGELAFYVEGDGGGIRRTVAGPGAVVSIAPGLEHTVRNESDRSAEATVIFSPAQPMERFARAAAALSAQGDPSPEQVVALAETHGVKVTRPIADAWVGDEPGEGREPRTFDSGFLTIVRFSGEGERLLDQYLGHAPVMSDVGKEHGLIAHVGAKTEDGLMIANLWPSKAESEAAAADPRRLDVLGQIGMTPDRVSREHHHAARMEIYG